MASRLLSVRERCSRLSGHDAKEPAPTHLTKGGAGGRTDGVTTRSDKTRLLVSEWPLARQVTPLSVAWLDDCHRKTGREELRFRIGCHRDHVEAVSQRSPVLARCVTGRALLRFFEVVLEARR